jgi:acetyltransferase-like isoleucine patch superfamily enzyme
MNELFVRIKLYTKGLFFYIFSKIRFGHNAQIEFLNAIRGKIDLSIGKGSTFKCEKKLRVDGPIYLKAVNGGLLNIGSNCYFNRNCSITALNKINIGNGCMFGNNVVVVDHDHIMSYNGALNEFKISDVNIEDGVWIGANSTILSGAKIGTGTIIAAGSVVKGECEAHSLYAGVPARFIKKLN